MRKVELAMREPRPEELQVMKFILFGEEYLLGFSIDLARRRFVLQFFIPRTNDEECTLMVVTLQLDLEATTKCILL
ncbi:hypothetical protein WGM54_18485 [Paenibacillus polymyxa]|uniref:hypothetical protein n=1 Tax=Paenibacillus polymyxa TaxID=1406 RepID=UPI00307E2F8F